MGTTTTATVVVAAALLLAGCGLTGQVERTSQDATASSSRTGTAVGSSGPTSTSPTGSGTSAASGPHVPGYAVGEIPPVPLFTLPDLSMLDTALGGFTIKVADEIGPYPGLQVQPARCDTAGNQVTDTSALTLYGDGSGTYTGPDGTVQNFGDGSGTYSLNGKTVQVFGDGSGNYVDGEVTVQSFGDGSGTYVDGTVSIQLFGDGSGNYTGPDGTIQNFGDGSGTYTNGDLTLSNFGDGSANYTDGTLTIQNFGDGTGTIDGVRTDLDPVDPVPVLGQFPAMGTIKPITSCGTTITLRDTVLFDFDQSTIRPEATTVLDSLSEAFADLGVTAAQVGGHTDSVGTDDYNQELSTRRAQAVVDALTSRRVTASLTATGFGETRPVAPNTLKDKDNPAGRQLNRRVEIFIPSAGGPR